MTVVVPSSLALTSIADGALAVAADHRNNFTAVQVGVNGLIAMFNAAPTKGDLVVSAGGGSFDKLGVGTNTQVLTADSTQALGVKWATPGGATRILTGDITGATGAINAGTGFTCSRSSAGVYVITFTVAFSAAPVAIAMPKGVAFSATVAASTTAVTFNFFNTSSVATDASFYFLITAMA